MNNNRICRIGEGLEHALPSLKELVLTNNNIQELGDLDPLASIKTLTLLSLLRNPVTNKRHYRLYVINKIPQIRVLDFQKVKMKERQEAERNVQRQAGVHSLQRILPSEQKRSHLVQHSKLRRRRLDLLQQMLKPSRMPLRTQHRWLKSRG
ncbi:hypothetical protein SKAU_G00349770 [Synaphobranchus kaupii]|uniref:U2A'/phosphoprotein 32 family A C-terminal domain-containing protein n=1 Tax=Synaphobranchus kaupii TaxID=118154 RepID=A0A9Q1EKB5_SYNKA|nr:hypothetical protein SKAU_G00349770 [Synaphobranchus kaupii]